MGTKTGQAHDATTPAEGSEITGSRCRRISLVDLVSRRTLTTRRAAQLLCSNGSRWNAAAVRSDPNHGQLVGSDSVLPRLTRVLRLLVDTSTWLDLAKRRDGQKCIVAIRLIVHWGNL